MLVALAALAAFWPRRSSTGFPFVALVLLVTLYAVPAVALDFDGEFLRGALLALLVLAFLRLERLRLTEAGAAAGARGRHGGRRADRGARARRRRAVVGLRDVGAVDRLLALDDVLLGPRLRPARLAARRPRDAAREGEAGRLLEGPEPRHLRRRALGRSRNDRHARGDPDRAAHRPRDHRALQRRRSTSRCATCAARTFVTAGIPLAPPVLPNRAAIPNGPPGIYVSSRTLRRGDTLHGAGLHARSRPSASCARPAASTTAISASTAPSRSPSSPASRLGHPARRRPRRSSSFPAVGRALHGPAVGVPARASATWRRGRATPSACSSARRSSARGRSRSGSSAAPSEPLDYVKAVEAYLGRGFTLHRGAARQVEHARRLPVRDEVRLLPAVLRARWRCCCAWAASPRAWRPASPPAPTTARRRSTSCATSTPTRGSRRGSPTTAG